MASTGAGNGIDGVIAQLDAYFGTGCPVQLPDGVREFLVRFGPWSASPQIRSMMSAEVTP